MRLIFVVLIPLIVIWITACAPLQPVALELTPIPTLAPATLPAEAFALPTAPPPIAEVSPGKPVEKTAQMTLAGLPLPADRGKLFSASGACSVCHTNMLDESGEDVSIDAYWRSSMLANSSRDPYWRASVRGEVLSIPEYQATIEDKCTTCHMPMARFTVSTEGEKGKALNDGFFDPDNPLHILGVDGVSCTVCHQIEPNKLGDPSTFSGGYVIDIDRPEGERLSFGPYVVDEALKTLMQSSSGFVPLEGKHLQESEVCAACHNLYTPTVDENGEIVGQFPEQALHLEWLHSDYRETQSCLDCHLPEAQGGVQLSITGGPLRSPFYKHNLVGGNVYMVGLLKTFGKELEVTASGEQFEATAQRTLDQLQNRTATLSISNAAFSGTQLEMDVIVESHTGHKIPSGFPSRRAWLHVAVRDGKGQTIFESGGVSENGFISGNDNDEDPTLFEPHYETIESSDQVQIYEAIMVDAKGEVMTILLHGAGYVKDNRLLPSGFDKETAGPDIAVHGEAMNDENFLGGGDQVHYVIDTGEAQGPFTIEAKLLYQTIGYRWANNLRRYDAPEPNRFMEFYDAVSNLPVTIAKENLTVGD